MRKKLSGPCGTVGLLMMAITLAGCANMATTGAGAVYNRHSIRKNFDDQYLTMKSYQALFFKTDEFKDSNIVISTYNGDILLTGQVPQASQKVKAGEIVKNIAPDNPIYNLISIENPSSTLTRMSDSWITGKVKAQLIASEDLDASKIKVVTENGTVYLMGIVPPEEAEAAVELASNTDGVQRVVKIFSYMTVSKKRQ